MNFLDKIKAEEGDVIVLGARPSMGKTGFLNLIIKENISSKKIVFVSTDTKKSMIEKRITEDLRTPLKLFEGDNPEIWDYKDFEGFSAESQLCHFEDYDYPKGTLILIDSVQMYSSIGNDSPKHRAIEEVLTRAKEIAIRNDFIIVFTSQLSRNIEERQGHRPRLSDYSASCSLEEIPDHCLLLYRREYYDPMDKPGIAEIIVAKSRRGVNDSFIYLYDSKAGKFIKEKNTKDIYG